MKLRIAIVVLATLVVAALVNAFVVTRVTRPAQPFAGGHVLELDGPDLNVREYGPPGERAIVLLHGYTASIEWWEEVAPELAHDQRVVAIDLVGHGGSEAPRDPAQFQADGQATAVHNALQQLGIRKAVLIGHSLGGLVATTFAEQHPDMVERLVVADTPGASDLVAMPALGEAVCWPVLGPALDHLRSVHAITESTLQPGFAADYRVPPLAYRSLEQLTYTGVCASTESERPAVADTVATLDTPVLVVYGEADTLAPTAANVERYTAAGFPPSIIAGSGHTPMVEKPEELLSAIRDFVAPVA